jgi:hypothetical protein
MVTEQDGQNLSLSARRAEREEKERREKREREESRSKFGIAQESIIYGPGKSLLMYYLNISSDSDLKPDYPDTL